MKKINVDSIYQVLPGLEGTEKIDALNKLSLAICRDFPDSSISLSIQSIALSKQLDYQKGLADGYFNLGNIYFFSDSLKPMVLNYLNSIKIYEQLGPSLELGLVYYQLTLINKLVGRYDQAKYYCQKAINTYQSIDEHKYWINAIYKMGRIFSYSSVWDSAFVYFDSAIVLLKTYPDNWILAGVYNQYGVNYTLQFLEGNTDIELLYKGIPWYFKCWELDKKYHGDVEMTSPIYNIGASLIFTGIEKNIQQGLEYIKIVKPISDTSTIKIHMKLLVYGRLGQNEYRKGNSKGAISLYKTGLSLAEDGMRKFSIKNYIDPQEAYIDKYNFKLNKQFYYNLIYQIYHELGDYKNALKYFSLKEKAAKEIYKVENTRLITILETEMQNEQTKNQITLLEKDNEVKSLSIKQSRVFNLGATFIFIVLALLGLLFIRQNKLKNEHKSTLLEQKLLRLQMNPHFIFNAFSNILRLIDTNENKKASVYLTTFGKLLRTTLESTREDMVPFEKEVGTLRNYLELQKLRLPEKFEYSLKLDDNIDQEDMSIPPMLVQPFIENAIEHGIRHKKTKGRIDISFELKNKKIVCEIEDDGVGREKAWEMEYAERGDRKSLATDIIKDRIHVLNKKFKQKIKLEIIDLQSEKSEALGTKVLLDLPYGSVY